jgi:hypothetical protein
MSKKTIIFIFALMGGFGWIFSLSIAYGVGTEIGQEQGWREKNAALKECIEERDQIKYFLQRSQKQTLDCEDHLRTCHANRGKPEP